MKISLDLGRHLQKSNMGSIEGVPALLLIDRNLRDQIYDGVSLAIEKLGRNAANMIEVMTFECNHPHRLEIKMVIVCLPLLADEERNIAKCFEVDFTGPVTLADAIIGVFAEVLAQEKLNVSALLQAYGSVHDPRKKICAHCKSEMILDGHGYLCHACFGTKPVEVWSER